MLWYLIFLLLTVEVLLVGVFCIPFLGVTNQIARSLTYFWERSSKLRTATMITFGVVVLMFLDSVYRVQRLTADKNSETSPGGGGRGSRAGGPGGPSLTLSFMFRAQRNAYISGFCLVLFVVLHRLLKNAQLLYSLKKENKQLRTQLGLPLKGPLELKNNNDNDNGGSSDKKKEGKQKGTFAPAAVAPTASAAPVPAAAAVVKTETPTPKTPSAPTIKDLKDKKND